ncbi:hypothetical protein [Nonomuraea dietziae]|uniref:hypothetical protein n=1 Tax=Nonomuraea dietziae TaxID=65515 RepID=UPI0033C390DA
MAYAAIDMCTIFKATVRAALGLGNTVIPKNSGGFAPVRRYDEPAQAGTEPDCLQDGR